MGSHRRFLADGRPNPAYDTTDKRSLCRGGAGRRKPYDADAFFSVDGEAVRTDHGKPVFRPGTHVPPYVFLRTSTAELYEATGLTTKDVFDFLLSQPYREGWLFGGTYDINQWLRDLDERYLRMLNDTGHCFWGDYRLEHVYGKMFRLTYRPIGKDGKHHALKSVTFWDASGFFQEKFLSVVDKLHLAETEDELTWLASMKDKREDFDLANIEQIKSYCRLEVHLLDKLVRFLKTAVRDFGLDLRQWYSAGSIASAAMAAQGVREHIGKVRIKGEGYCLDYGEKTAEVLAAVREAYHGGRAEVGLLGQVEGEIHNIDIHSAYVAGMIDLPSLKDARWEHVVYDTPFAVSQQNLASLDDHSLYRVSWLGRHKVWGAFPVKPMTGSLRYPHKSIQPYWFWGVEVKAAASIAHVVVHEAWLLHPATSEKPFAYLADYYSRKQEAERTVGKSSAQYQITKLAMLSAYGKTVQQSGYGDSLPLWYQPVWGGLTTAWTRAKLLEVISTHDVLMCATDGVLVRGKLSLPLTADTLGTWGCDTVKGSDREQVYRVARIMSSGFYFLHHDAGAVRKTRGFLKSDKENEDEREELAIWQAWKEYVERSEGRYRPDVDVPRVLIGDAKERFIGYKSALMLNDFGLWGQWLSAQKELKLSLEPRRVPTRFEGYALLSKPPLVATSHIDDVIAEKLLAQAIAMEFEDVQDIEQPDAGGRE